MFWVCGCLCAFHRDPIRTSNKTQAISFCSLSSFHHWQGRDMISNKMFSLCSEASHGCSKGLPSVLTALQNNSFRPHIKLCVGDALLCWSSANLNLNPDYYEENHQTKWCQPERAVLFSLFSAPALTLSIGESCNDNKQGGWVHTHIIWIQVH